LISTIQDEPDEAPKLDWSRVQNVLLVRLRSIGDTVLMTPCLEAIKALRSDIAITVVSEPLSAPILEDHPLVDRLIVSSATVKARAKLIKTLRRSGFDVAFDLHGGTTASLIAALSSAKQSVGYAGYRYSRLLKKRAPAPDIVLQRSAVHSVEQQLALLHWTGVPWPEAQPRLSLKVCQPAEQLMRERLQSCGLNLSVKDKQEATSQFAIIAPAAAFETKRWSSRGFAQVVDYVSEKWNLPSVIIAGLGQEEIARKVASLSTARPHVITGLNLKELMALIRLCGLFVGNDSGPMHIAAAFNCPVVGLFGSSNPDVWHPWTTAPSRVVAAAGSEEIRSRARQPVELATQRRIKELPVKEVIAAVDEVLKAAAVADFKAVAS
jgi:heptosyltransferase-3